MNATIETPASLREQAAEKRRLAHAYRDGAEFAEGSFYAERREAGRLDREALALERRAAELEGLIGRAA